MKKHPVKKTRVAPIGPVIHRYRYYQNTDGTWTVEKLRKTTWQYSCTFYELDEVKQHLAALAEAKTRSENARKLRELTETVVEI